MLRPILQSSRYLVLAAVIGFVAIAWVLAVWSLRAAVVR